MCAQETKASRVMKILVVDDEQTTVKLYLKLLDEMGHKAVVAMKGEEAVEKVDKERFDLVILDLVLPDIHGSEVLRRIKDKLQGAPVVIVTANPSLESSIDAIKTGGVYDYITKPFGHEELSMVVRRAVEKAGLMTENRRLFNRLEATNKALTERVDQLEKCAHMAFDYDKKIKELENEIKKLHKSTKQVKRK